MNDDPQSNLEARIASLEATVSRILEHLSLSASSIETPEEAAPHNIQYLFDVISVTAKPSERNSSWVKFAWKLTLKNNINDLIRIDACIQFKDSDDFVLDDANAYSLLLHPHEEATFSDYKLIDLSIADMISSVGVLAEAST